MKKTRLLGGLSALALLAGAGAAYAQPGVLAQDSAWQFRTSDQTAVLQNNFQIQRQHEIDKKLKEQGFVPGSAGSGGLTGGGLLGAGADNIANYTQINNVTSNTNSCSAAAGASLSCGASSMGSGGNTSSVGQTTSSTSQTATTTTEGNTIRNNPSNTYNTGGTGGTNTFSAGSSTGGNG